MTFKKTLKIILLILLFLAIVAYLVYTFFGMESTNPDEECVEVTVLMEDGQEAFVDSAMVVGMMESNGLYPVGKKMKDVDLQEIKKVIESNPFVVTAECYQTNNGMDVGKGRLCVKIRQNIPVMMVYDDKNGMYYVDANATVIKTDTLYARNILVANGEINRNYLPELAALAHYISSDDFWDNQIEQIYVSYNKMKEREITLIPRVGNQKILLGDIENYDKKLTRLKKFYERGISKVGWNKYSILNLEYDNQVVGVISGQEIVVANEPDEAESKKAETKEADNKETSPEVEKKDTVSKKEDVKKENVKNEEPKKEESKKEEPKKEELKKEPVKKQEPEKN